MSAFIVSNNHLKAIVIATGNLDTTDIEKKCNVLQDENVRSVDYRYNETNASLPVKVSLKEVAYGRSVSVVQALKLCDCLEYQSCETPDYWHSDAYRLLEEVRGQLIRKLPGYEEAEWAI